MDPHNRALNIKGGQPPDPLLYNLNYMGTSPKFWDGDHKQTQDSHNSLERPPWINKYSTVGWLMSLTPMGKIGTYNDKQLTNQKVQPLLTK